MSATTDQNPLSPNDPAYYAPRLPRDADAARLPRLGETLARFGRPRPPLRIRRSTGSSRPRFTSCCGIRSTPKQSKSRRSWTSPGLLGVVGRVATAIGAAAFVALLFVIVIPSLRQQNADPSAAEVINSMKSALSKSEQAAKPSEPQPWPELQSILASSEEGHAVSHEEF